MFNECTVSFIACFCVRRVTGMVPVQEIVRYVLYLSPTFFDKKSWDTSTERCFSLLARLL